MGIVQTIIGRRGRAETSDFRPTADIPKNDDQSAIQYVYATLFAAINALSSALKAPQYLVAASSSDLDNERVATDTATVAWDFATAAQAKANVPNNAITDAKLRQGAAVSVVGRSANSAGNVADIAAGANDRLLSRVADALGFTQLTAGMVPNALITSAMLRDSAAVSVIGRSANSVGVPADIAASADDQILRRVASALSFGALTIGMAAANLWTFAKLQQIAGLSVPGVAGASTADMAAITAANDGEVLRRSGSTLGFGTVATAGIADNAVSNAKIRDSAAVSVIGRSANSTGDPADIAAGANDRLLARVSDALSWVQLTVGMIADGIITYAKLQNISATQRVLGRNTAGAGVTEEVTVSQLLDWIGSTRGSILYRGASGWAILAPGTSTHVLTSNGAGADPSYQAPSGGGGTEATQAQVEAQSSTTTFISPAKGKYLPGVAKAWCRIRLASGTVTNEASENISSVTDNGAGDYTFNFSTSFSSANYAILATPAQQEQDTAAHRGFCAGTNRLADPTSSACRIACITATVATGIADPEFLSVEFNGDQ